jgi:hypothetical protein
MRTQSPSQFVPIRFAFANARETMFHKLLIFASSIAVWIMLGSMNVNGQTYEMLSPGHASTPIEFSDSMTDASFGHEYFMNDNGPSATPHRILQPPGANPLRSTHSPYSQAPYGATGSGSARSNHASTNTAKQIIDETLHTEGPLLRRLHEHKQPPLAKIPDATVEPQWKVPYAYGYFGASGTRHWTKSSGYRDTYKRWTKE